MIGKILANISISHLSDEAKQTAFSHYKDMMESKGWDTHCKYLVEMGNLISLYMLSSEYTKLDPNEKDVQQRAFYMVKEVLEFLLNPLKTANSLTAMKQFNNRDATKRQPGRKPK